MPVLIDTTEGYLQLAYGAAMLQQARLMAENDALKAKVAELEPPAPEPKAPD